MNATKERREWWTGIVNNGWLNAPDDARTVVIEALIEADESGKPSCLWHETHKWTRANVVLPECPHCGGPADARIGFHHLCAAFIKRGLPIARKLDVRSNCPCTPCRRERGEL